jgi:hypothetical protein
MSGSLRKVESLRHAVRHSTLITLVASAVFLAATLVAGSSPYLLAALLIPLAEFVACYRLGWGQKGTRPEELKFLVLVAHALFLTAMFVGMPDGLPRIAGSVQYLALSFVALGIGSFAFRSHILAALAAGEGAGAEGG